MDIVKSSLNSDECVQNNNTYIVGTLGLENFVGYP